MEILILTIVGTVIGTVLAIEAKAWMPYVGSRLVRGTLERMPRGLEEQMRSRWAEEIEADHATLADRPVGGLVFAVGLCLKGGRRLAAELALQEAVAPLSASKVEQQHPFAWSSAEQLKTEELLTTALIDFMNNADDSNPDASMAVQRFARDLVTALGTARARHVCLVIGSEFAKNPDSYVPEVAPGRFTQNRLRAMALLLLQQAQKEEK